MAECYGRDPEVRQALRQRVVGYVLAVARNDYSQIATHLKERVDVTEAWLTEQAWRRYSCGPGSKGERYYDWVSTPSELGNGVPPMGRRREPVRGSAARAASA